MSSSRASSLEVNNNNPLTTTTTTNAPTATTGHNLNTGLVGTFAADALHNKSVHSGSPSTSPLTHHYGATPTSSTVTGNPPNTNNQSSTIPFNSNASQISATPESSVDCTLKSTTTTNLTAANMERRSTVPGATVVATPATVTPKSNNSKRNGSNRGTAGYTSVTCSLEGAEEYLKPIYQDGQVILEVECGQNKALMYLSKLCQGSKGPCIYFQGSWLTPNEFQYVSGRESAKDWKRSIRHHGKSMKLLLSKGILTVHSAVCDCEGCRISSPVNRCRLAEKRVDSRDSPMRDERCLTGGLVEWKVEENLCNPKSPLDCPKSCDDSDNSSNDLDRKSLKRCSPLRESRLNNIIDQLRTTREKEGLNSGDEDDTRMRSKKCYDLALTNGHNESSENINGLSPNHKSGSFENHVNDENQSLNSGSHESNLINRMSLPEDISGKRAKLELDAIEKDAMKEDVNDTNEMALQKKKGAVEPSNARQGETPCLANVDKPEEGSCGEADDEVDVTSNDDEDNETDASTRLKQEELAEEDGKQQEKADYQSRMVKVEQANSSDCKASTTNADEGGDAADCKQRLGVEECEACDAAMKRTAEANASVKLMLGLDAKNNPKFVKDRAEIKGSTMDDHHHHHHHHPSQGCDASEEMSDIAQKIYREVSEKKLCQDIANSSHPHRNIAEEIYRECRENKSLEQSLQNNNNNNNNNHQSHNNNNNNNNHHHKDMKFSPNMTYNGKHVGSPPRNIAEEIYLQSKSECKDDCKKDICCNLAFKESSKYARNIAQEIYREGHEKRQSEESLLQHHQKLVQDMYRDQKSDDAYHPHSHSQNHLPKDSSRRRDIAQEIYHEVRGEHLHGQGSVSASSYAHKTDSNKDRHRDQRDVSVSKSDKQSTGSGKDSHNHHHHHHHHHKDRQREGSKDKHLLSELSPKIKTNGIESKEDKQSRSLSPSRETKEKEKENGKYSDFMRLLAASHLQPKLVPHVNGYEQYLHRFRPAEAAAAALHPGFSPLLQNCMLYGHPAFLQREPCFFPQALQLASLQGLQGQFISPFVYPPRIPLEAPRMLELFRPMPYMPESLLTQCSTPTPSSSTSPTSHCTPSTVSSCHTSTSASSTISTSSTSSSSSSSSSSTTSNSTISSSGAHKRSSSSDVDKALDLSTKRIKLDYHHHHHHPSGFRLNGNSSGTSSTAALSNGKDKRSSTSSSASCKSSSLGLNGLNMSAINGNVSAKLDSSKSSKHIDGLVAKTHPYNDLSHGCTCTFKKGIVPRYIHQWTVNEVCQFITQLDGCVEYTEVFRDNQITGKMLLALNRDHLMSSLGMKVAAALLLTEAVAMQQKKETAYKMCNYCQQTAKEVIVS